MAGKVLDLSPEQIADVREDLRVWIGGKTDGLMPWALAAIDCLLERQATDDTTEVRVEQLKWAIDRACVVLRCCSKGLDADECQALATQLADLTSGDGRAPKGQGQ